MANLTTFYCHGMPISDEQAVELFKNLDIVVMCRDGSKWLHGERYDEFAHLQKAVALVKELIADTEWGRRKEETMPDLKNYFASKLDNNQLADELITRYAGMPPHMRTTIMQAAHRLKALDIQLSAMAAALKKAHGCDGCAHRNCDFDKDPCVSCLKEGNYSKWKWKGA